MNRKILILITVLCLALASLAGCGNTDSLPDDNKLNVVCTIFPEYDWLKEVISSKEDLYDVTLLLDNGSDLHSYQPTALDIAKITTADLFIYVGGESDAWVEDALKEAVNKDMKVVNLLDALGEGVKEEELVEGMEAEEDEDEAGEEPEYDEHVWLSIRNSIELVKAINEAVISLDSDNASVYNSNTDNYIKLLTELDNKYESAIKGASYDTILFGDRFPFRYLADDYGLNYFAAFAGCSAESEASFETVTFLSGKVNELGLKKVLVIENSDKKIAEAIIENTASKDQEVLVLNSLQSVTGKDIEGGASYIKIMEDNLLVLNEALN